MKKLPLLAIGLVALCSGLMISWLVFDTRPVTLEAGHWFAGVFGAPHNAPAMARDLVKIVSETSALIWPVSTPYQNYLENL